jgi:sulfopyruvate decarboxylase subunit beta
MAIPFRDCFEYLAKRWEDELVVTSAGNSGQMWWDITGNFEQVFYLDASMSMSTLFASGIAWSLPDSKVWAFMGDGAFCMNPGMLMVENDLNLPNLKHILVSNRVYGATSDIDLPNKKTNDYIAMAKSMGLERTYSFETMEDLEAGFDGAFRGNRDGHTFVVLELDPLLPGDARLEVPPMDGPELKFRFGRFVERNHGCKIFSHQI